MRTTFSGINMGCKGGDDGGGESKCGNGPRRNSLKIILAPFIPLDWLIGFFKSSYSRFEFVRMNASKMKNHGCSFNGNEGL